MRVGLIGGTFNPIHIGHLNSASEICETFQLDNIIFIPTYITPQKDKKIIISAELRLEMLKMACMDNEKFQISEIEIERKGVSYSIDTVKSLKQGFNASDEIFFITGTDVFSEMSLWKSPDELLKICNLIVNVRASFKLKNFMNVLDKNITSKYNNIKFSPFEKDSKTGCEKIGVVGSNTSIYLTSTTQLSISSTEIRRRIKENKSFKYLLPRNVYEYINKNKLYFN